MISPERTEENGALMRASALAQLNSELPMTSLSNPSGSSPYQAPRERPKSPREDPTEYGGHLRNKYRPYPLSLISFDLSEPYEASEYLTIRPYNEACQADYLGEDWVDMYKGGLIIDEQDFDDTYVRPYLDQFIQQNVTSKRTAFKHQANLKAVFYGGKDKEWAKLDLVDEYRRQTGKVLGVVSQGLCRKRHKAYHVYNEALSIAS